MASFYLPFDGQQKLVFHPREPCRCLMPLNPQLVWRVTQLDSYHTYVTGLRDIALHRNIIILVNLPLPVKIVSFRVIIQPKLQGGY